MSAQRTASVTVDLDGLRNYGRIHDLEGTLPASANNDPIFGLALERMLELFAELGVKATLFCVGEDLEHPNVRRLLTQAVAEGHELGNHSYSHLYDLRSRPEATIRDEIARCGAQLEAITGRPPAGFRTPGYNLSPTIAKLLVESGYLYDSSLFPCPAYWAAKGAVMARMRLSGRQSRSQMTLPQTLTSPLAAYLADPERPWRRATRGATAIHEVPMCLVPGLRFPLIGTSLHLVGGAGFRRLMPILKQTYKHLIQLEFHGIDFLDGGDEGVPLALSAVQPDLRIGIGQKLATWREVLGAVRHGYDFGTLEDGVRG